MFRVTGFCWPGKTANLIIDLIHHSNREGLVHRIFPEFSDLFRACPVYPDFGDDATGWILEERFRKGERRISPN